MNMRIEEDVEEITIKDIARICKVGVSTVSRAINNHPDINPETKKMIMAVSYTHLYQRVPGLFNISSEKANPPKYGSHPAHFRKCQNDRKPDPGIRAAAVAGR